MLAFEDVLTVRLTQLDEAVTDWTETVTKLKKLAEHANDTMAPKADKADWRGENAGVTRPFIKKTAKEFNDAVTEATNIRDALRTAGSNFRKHKAELEALIQQAPQQQLHIDSRGFVSSTHKDSGAPRIAPKPSDQTATPSLVEDSAAEQAKVDAMVARIEKVLTRATEDDETTARTLAAITGKDPHNFTSYTGLKEAQEARAIADAKAVARLATKEDLTDAELNRVNDYLETHKNDPVFGEALATELGAKGTLELWANLADPHQTAPSPQRDEALERFQENLSMSLASATRSDSPEMQAWEKQVVALGNNRIGTDGAGGPYGFQVMSNLMRHGKYDGEFLNNYGDALLKMDKKYNNEDAPFWTSNANRADLNLGDDNDRGSDPMVGFLEALGHNPEASADFFQQPAGVDGAVDEKSEINKDLAYLTQEREWWPDSRGTSDSDVLPGRDALGHALEAATTGYAYNAPELTGSGAVHAEDRRNASSAAVMEQIVEIYGSNPSLLHTQPEMTDSLGKMGSAYIDDINYAISGMGESEGTKDGGDFPANYEGRAQFSNQGAIDFLSVMGQNETTHAYMARAETLYTVSALDAFPPPSEENYHHAADVLLTEAEARGILDGARVGQAEADYGQDSEKANESLGKTTKWIETVVGIGVGAGVACIPVPGAAVAGATMVPFATEAAGELLNTFIGQELERAAKDAEENPEEKIQVTRRQFYEAGQNDIARMYESYFSESDKAEKTADHANLLRDIKNTYTATGPNAGDYRGMPAYRG